MRVRLFDDQTALSLAASADAARMLRGALARRKTTRLVAATGTSQISFLDNLCLEAGIAWDRVELFHLDEYLGLGSSHPASFARYVRERLVDRTGIRTYHLLDGGAPPERTIRDVGGALRAAPVDLLFAGVGENGHLAFNDPPANFETDDPYLVVELDEACRRQQVGEGWFRSVDEVPARALTMSVRQILRAEAILCLVSGARKARAVAACFGDGPIAPAAPASILREHAGAVLYLDRAAASELTAAQIARWTAPD